MRTLLTALLAVIATTTTKAIDIKSAIAEYYKKFPQEKIFIHTDKDQYMAGDTVWFRAHLVDAMTMTERSESKFVYVELYDSNMSLVDRHMVKADSLGVFANALRLSPQMATGAYTLMAYTTWMQNFPNRRFFYKRLIIAEKDARDIAPAQDVTYVGGNELPVSDVNMDIKLSQRNEFLQVQYEHSEGVSPADLSLAIFGSGNIIVVDSLTDKPVTFRQQDLFSGAVNIAVVNRNTGAVVAERLAFIKGAGLPNVAVNINQNDSKAKTLDISIKNIMGAPLTGDFSISVTDADVVERDSTQQDIATYLLLGSELEPLQDGSEWNFGSAASAVKQDIILSQQTDMRFNLSDMLNGTLPTLTYDIQRDQRISGTVQGSLRKKLKTPRITLFNPAGGEMNTYELPYNSHFNLTDMDFTDGATFIVEATRHTGSNTLVKLELDEPSRPTPYAIKARAHSNLLTDDFLKYERMHAAINGINEINYLEEIEVKGHKTSKDEGQRGFSVRPNYDRDTDGPTMYNDMRAWLLAMGYPRRTNVIIYIDEIRSSYEELLRLDPKNVKSIHNFDSYTDLVNDFYEPKKSYLNTPVGGFFISVVTRNYKPSVSDNPLAIQAISPLGYMPPVSTAAFDTPREEGAPDVRTTLYWSPYVKLTDDGEASVTFYPTDTSKRYRVTLQGVTTTGQIISKEIEL